MLEDASDRPSFESQTLTGLLAKNPNLEKGLTELNCLEGVFHGIKAMDSKFLAHEGSKDSMSEVEQAQAYEALLKELTRRVNWYISRFAESGIIQTVKKGEFFPKRFENQRARFNELVEDAYAGDREKTYGKKLGLGRKQFMIPGKSADWERSDGGEYNPDESVLPDVEDAGIARSDGGEYNLVERVKFMADINELLIHIKYAQEAARDGVSQAKQAAKVAAKAQKDSANVSAAFE